MKGDTILASFGERLRKRREEKDITLKQIENDTGISNSNLSRIERNLVSPSVEIAAILAEYLDESLDYLARGICKFAESYPKDFKDLYVIYSELPDSEQKYLLRFADYLLTKNPPLTPSNLIDKHQLKVTEQPSTYQAGQQIHNSVYIPILGTAAAGNPILTEEVLDGFVPMSKDLINGQAFLVRIKGDSMIEEGINDGDLALVRPQPVVNTGEIALVKYDNEVTVKKFYQEDNLVRLKPANPKHKDIIIRDLQLVKVLGKVIKVITQAEADRSIKHVEDHRQ